MTPTQLNESLPDGLRIDNQLRKTFGKLADALTDRPNAELHDLIAPGWEATYTALFGAEFVDSLAKHHKEAVEWHWNSRLALLRGSKPEYFAYFPIWSRGHMKSTIAEHIAVVDAVLSVAYNKPGFCLYVGREKTKVTESIGNIETLLYLPGVRKYAPTLSQVGRSEERNQNKQWTATFLHTQGRYVFKGGSTESTQAGSRIDKTRPTLIMPDDIDGREDSPTISDRRFKRLTGEILPMRQSNTLVFFAQNLISRFSVMYRIHSEQVQVLTNRKPTNPIPAVEEPFFTEPRVRPNGIMYDHFLPERSGKSTWHIWDADRIQEEIDTEGLPAFLRECQHEVQEAREGLVHKTYDDEVHAISMSQLAAIYGAEAWKNWVKIPFNDWARTKSKFHANVAGYFAVSSANTELPGITFLLPMSFNADAQPADVAARLLSVLTPYAYGSNGDRKTWADLIDEAWKRTNAQQHFESVAERIAFEKNYYKKVIPHYTRPVLKAYRVGEGAMSHSEDKVREMFNEGFGFDFMPSNPGKTEALEDIDLAMKVDYKSPHLFKPDVMGYTRWYVLCPDDLKATPYLLNGEMVHPPVAYPLETSPAKLHDSALFRYQMCNRRFRPPKLTETGELIDELEKSDDDFGQGMQMVYLKGLLRNVKLTAEERQEEMLPPAFRMSVIQNQIGKVPEEEIGRALVTRQVKIAMPKILGQKKPTGGIGRFKR